MSNETIDGTEAGAYRLNNSKYTLNPTEYKFSKVEVTVALSIEH